MTTFNTAIITRSHTSKMATLDEMTQLFNERDNKQLSIINSTTFHGRPNENCYLFLRSFEQYCDFNSVKDDAKLKLFVILLKGLAANWYDNLDDANKKTYTDVKRHFTEHFQSNKVNFLNQQMLEAIKHEELDPIEVYIEKVLQHSNNLGLHDNEKKQALLRGLPADMKAQLITQGPDSVMDTIQKLLLIDQGYAIKRQQAKVDAAKSLELSSISTALANIEKIVTQPPQMSRSATPHGPAEHRAAAPHYGQMQWTGRNPGTPSPPRFMGNCFTCGRNGHISRNCFSRTGCRSTPQSRMRDAYRPPNSYTRNHHWLPRGPRNNSTYEGNSQPRQY